VASGGWSAKQNQAPIVSHRNTPSIDEALFDEFLTDMFTAVFHWSDHPHGFLGDSDISFLLGIAASA
jgi:hypothetical protein